MPNWKKVITSGSNAELNHITASGDIKCIGSIRAQHGEPLTINTTGMSEAEKLFVVNEDSSEVFSVDENGTVSASGNLYLAGDSVNDVGIEVVNSSSPKLRLRDTSNNFRLELVQNNQYAEINFDDHASHDLHFHSNAHAYPNAHMLLDSGTGNTGIGGMQSSQINAKLHINGNLKTNSSITASGDISASSTVIATSVNSTEVFTAQLSDKASGGDTNIAINDTTLQIDVGGETHLQSTGTTAKFLTNITASGNISASNQIISKHLILPTTDGTSIAGGGLSFGTPGNDHGHIYDDGDNLNIGYNDAEVISVHDTGTKVSVLGNLKTTSHITASGNISASGDVLTNQLKVQGNTAVGYHAGSNSLLFSDTGLGTGIKGSSISFTAASGPAPISSVGHITSSGNISSSGLLMSSASIKTGLDKLVTYDTSTGQFHITASSGFHAAGGGSADNLGNHTATQDLDLDGNDIFDVQHITASGNISSSLASTGSFGRIETRGNISSSGTINANVYNIGQRGAIGILNNDVAFASDSNINTIAVGKSNDSTPISLFGSVTASGNISSSGKLIGTRFRSTNNQFIGALNDDLYFSSGLKTTTHITASGNISSSGGIVAPSLTLDDNQFLSFDPDGTCAWRTYNSPGGDIMMNRIGGVGGLMSMSGSDGKAFVGINIGVSGAHQNEGLTVNGMVSASGNFVTEGNITSSGFQLLGSGTAELEVDGHITASGDISGSGASSTAHMKRFFAKDRIATPEIDEFTTGGGLLVVPHITASGNISSSGGNYIGNRQFDKTSDTDATHQGDIVYLGGTTSMTPGKIYHYKSDGTWELGNTDTAATSDGLLAVALGAASDTNGMLLRGTVTLDHDPGAVGDVLFLSGSGGNASATAPALNNNVVRVIGYCLDASNGQIWFNPDNTFVEVSA